MPLACPLCKNPVRTTHLSKTGVCMFCEDSRRDSRRDNAEKAKKLAQVSATKAENMSNFIAQNHVKMQDRAVELVKQQQQKMEEKRIAELNKEQGSIALAKRSLLHYIERRKPSYDASWAHEIVASEIERFVQAVADRKSPRLILQLASRFGKKISDSTEVFTAEGWKLHGNLVPGDQVFDMEGNPATVEAVAIPTPCDMEVELSTGEVIQTHSDHEWVVFDRAKPVWRIWETKELGFTRKGTKRKLLTFDKHAVEGSSIFRLPNTPRLNTQDIELPMDPYVLAAWLGDGTTGASCFTHHPAEMEVMNEIERRGYEKTSSFYNFKAGSCRTAFGGRGSKYGLGPLTSDLAKAGVLKHKHIPALYLRAGTRQRLELLAGLIDTDGTVDKSSRVSFTTASKELREGYMELVRSLGWRPYYTTVQPSLSTSGIQGKQEYYQIGFQPDRDDIPVVLPRKKVFRTVPVQTRGVVDVRRIENGELGRCIQVSSPTGTYLVGRSMIPTHNSELASDSGPAWILGNHPDWNIVIASYSDKLPMNFSRSVREQLRSPDFHQIFPSGGRVSVDDASAKSWSTTQGGGMMATGVGGGLLGFGCDVLIVDDPVKDMEEADSGDTLEKIYDWFSSVAYSRQMPGAGILVIQQRMSHEDLVGKLIDKQKEEEAKLEEMRADAKDLALESPDGWDDIEVKNLLAEAEELDISMDRWRVVGLPALATANEYYDDDAHEIVHLPDWAEPKPHLRLLRKKGEAIHPKRYGRHYYLKLKRGNPRRFAAMYQLEPQTNDGAYFNKDQFTRYQPGKHPKLPLMNRAAAWDLAIGTKQYNDSTVGLAGGMDYNGRLWLLERVKGKFGDIVETSNLIIDLHKRWDVSITGIERTHIEMAMGPILRTRMRERNEFITLAEGKEALKPIHDKKVRARTLQGLAQAGKIMVPEGDEWDDFINILCKFGASSIDDDVDAAAWLAILLTRTAPPRDPMEELKRQREEAFKSWYDELVDEMTSRSGSFMES